MYIFRYAIEKMRRFAAVGYGELISSACDAGHSFIGQVFWLVTLAGGEDSDQRASNLFVLESRGIAVVIEPQQ